MDYFWKKICLDKLIKKSISLSKYECQRNKQACISGSTANEIDEKYIYRLSRLDAIFYPLKDEDF